jgi:hypothetical protein
MKEKAMRPYLKSNKSLRILLSICLLCLLLIVLAGFQDFNVREIKTNGVACTLQARIVDMQTLQSGTQVLLVKALPTAVKGSNTGQTIDVLVTSETTSRFGDRTLKFGDFRVGMLIEIQGLKVIERDNGIDTTVILAQRIRRLLG